MKAEQDTDMHFKYKQKIAVIVFINHCLCGMMITDWHPGLRVTDFYFSVTKSHTSNAAYEQAKTTSWNLAYILKTYTYMNEAQSQKMLPYLDIS